MEQDRSSTGSQDPPIPRYTWKVDFQLKYGNGLRGFREALIPFFLLIIAPLAIIQFILISSGSFLPEISDSLRSSLSNLNTTLVIYGILVTIFGFIRGYYSKGTFARLVFSEIEVLLLFLYSYFLFYTSTLPDILGEINWQLDLPSLFLLSLYPISLVAVAFGTEYTWNRNDWLKFIGYAMLEPKVHRTDLATEFSPKFGIIPEANRQARSSILLLIILPALLILLIPPSLTLFVSLPTQVAQFLSVLPPIADALILLGIPLFLISWFYGFYQKGSYGRLTLGLVYAAFLILYIWEVFVASDLEQGFIDLGANFDYALLSLLLLVIPLFLAIETLGELVDERDNWKKRVGIPVESRPIDVESRWLDFSPRIGKIGAGARLSLIAYVLFIILPVLVLTLISGTLESFDFQNNQGMADAFKQVLDAIIPFSIAIVIFSFPRGFYPKGSMGRFVFGSIVVLLILFLVNAAFLSGGLESAFLASGAIVDLDPLLLVLLLYVALGVVVVVAELIDNRRNWLKGVGRRVEPWTRVDAQGMGADFRARFATFVNGAKKGKGAFRRYIIYITIFIIILIAALEYLNDPVYGASIDVLQTLLGTILIFGILVVVAQILRASYPRGSVSRLTFGLIAVVFIILFFYEFIGGLIDVLLVAVEAAGGSSELLNAIEPYLNYLLTPFLAWAAFLAIWYIIQFFIHRREWKELRAKLIDQE